MSGAQEQRRRRPPKMFLVVSDLKFQDQLDGTIRLLRGNICQEQDAGRTRGEHIWVKVGKDPPYLTHTHTHKSIHFHTQDSLFLLCLPLSVSLSHSLPPSLSVSLCLSPSLSLCLSLLLSLSFSMSLSLSGARLQLCGEDWQAVPHWGAQWAERLTGARVWPRVPPQTAGQPQTSAAIG